MNLKNVELIRNRPFRDATFGMVKFEDKLLCYSLERPWIDNLNNLSCIPCGNYRCEVVTSPKMKENGFNEGRVYQIKNVPNRSSVLIHPANKASELEGCISFGKLPDMIRKELLYSRDCIEWFMGIMMYEPFMLTIKDE